MFPSAIIKPVPSFMFSVPEAGCSTRAPDALAVARTPEQIDGFWVNAILSHDRVARAVDFKQAAQRRGRGCRRLAVAKVTMERLARFGTNVVYLRGAELEAPKSGRPLAQLHALFFAPRRARARRSTSSSSSGRARDAMDARARVHRARRLVPLHAGLVSHLPTPKQ